MTDRPKGVGAARQTSTTRSPAQPASAPSFVPPSAKMTAAAAKKPSATKASVTASATTSAAKTSAAKTPARPTKKPARKALAEPTRRAAAPLQVDPTGPDVDGHALVRAEQCIALLQRRLIKPMGRGGPRGDLTLTQYHALSFLAARGQASVSELKDILGFAQSTTSVLVEKLSRMGLVEKLRDGRDHRLACVVPLPKGLRLVQRYRKNAERNLLALRSVLGEEAVLDVFTALEQALVATAPLEDPRVTRLANSDAFEAEDQSDGDEDDILQAAE